jgi:hypothetical protein
MSSIFGTILKLITEQVHPVEHSPTPTATNTNNLSKSVINQISPALQQQQQTDQEWGRNGSRGISVNRRGTSTSRRGSSDSRRRISTSRSGSSSRGSSTSRRRSSTRSVSVYLHCLPPPLMQAQHLRSASSEEGGATAAGGGPVRSQGVVSRLPEHRPASDEEVGGGGV